MLHSNPYFVNELRCSCLCAMNTQLVRDQIHRLRGACLLAVLRLRWGLAPAVDQSYRVGAVVPSY